MANNININDGGSDFLGILRSAVEGPPDIGANILDFLKGSPVADVTPNEYLQSQTGLQSVQDNQNKVLRNRYDMAADFPFLTPGLKEFQNATQGGDENTAKAFQEMLRTGRARPSELEADATTKKNKALLEMLGFGTTPSANDNNTPSAHPAETPKQDLTVVTHDGKELSGDEAQKYLADQSLIVQEEKNKPRPPGAPPLKPKISVDNEGNMKLSFDPGSTDAGDTYDTEKKRLEVKKAKRDAGEDTSYINDIFPGYESSNPALSSQATSSPRILKDLKQTAGSTENVVSNLTQMQEEIKQKGIPINPRDPRYQKLKQLYSNAKLGAMDLGGTHGGDSEGGGIVSYFKGKDKLIDDLVPDPTGPAARSYSTEQWIDRLENAKNVIQGDLDSTLGAYHYTPKKSVIATEDGSMFTVNTREKDQALDYIRGKRATMPSSMKKTREGRGEQVQQTDSSRVPIFGKNGEKLGTTSIKNLEKDKAALRAQGIEVQD